MQIKPKGYYFHQKYYQNFQGLINWFKENFNKKDYVKEMKRNKSPRIQVAPKNEMLEGLLEQPLIKDPLENWDGVPDQWKANAQPGSVHDMNDQQNDFYGTPFVKSEMIPNSSYQRQQQSGMQF